MVKTALRLATRPTEAFLALHMAAFIARVPRLLAKGDLPTVLRSLRKDRFVPRAPFERIRTIRGICLRLAPLANRNTCYVRALALYRYVDAPDDALAVHLGIEHQDAAHTRLHGHAWVTLRGAVLEAPTAVTDGKIYEIPLQRGCVA